MLAKRFAVFFVVFFFIFSLSAPAFSSSGNMRYDKYYDLDGRIMLMIQSGDKGSSSAQQKTLVEGSGAFRRNESVFLDPTQFNVIADSDWSVDEDLLRGLSVGSAIKLNEDLSDLSEKEAEQVFAVKMGTDPGEEGHLLQDWSLSEVDYDHDDNDNDQEQGTRFVIDQDAFTSGGEMKRYIDMLPPGSEIYLFEDSEIKGYARITDSLQPEAGDNDGGDQGGDNEDGTEEDNPEGEGGFLTTTETEPDQETDLEQQSFVLQDEQFETTVPLGTPLEEIELDQTVSLTAGLVEITDIKVEWKSDTMPAYDPDQEGSYALLGKLSFPEAIVAPDNIFLLYTIHVGEEPDGDLEADEEEKSDSEEEDPGSSEENSSKEDESPGAGDNVEKDEEKDEEKEDKQDS